MGSPKLEVKDISKSFPGVHALRGVSICAQKGEIISLVGENGAGKSTLMNVISGQIKPDHGAIFIDGNQARIESPADAISLGIGLVPQEINLIPQLSVAENIFLGTKKLSSTVLRNVDWKAIRSDAKKALERLDVTLDVTQLVGGMSVANQQLVQIARVLCLGANIIIFDEPTACLTSKESERLLALIRQFSDEGKLILFISHHLEEVMEISDRIVVMRDGSQVAVIEKGDYSAKRLIRDMVGEDVAQGSMNSRETTGDTILKVEGLTRTHEFEDVSFEVKKGEIFGIAGLVGAGRTELVSTIFMDRKPQKGSVWFDGEILREKGPGGAIRKGIGYIPEERRNYGILPTMSVGQNLSVSLLKKLFRFPRIDTKKEKQIIDEYCNKVKVKMVNADELLLKLSGGNQQKVIIARWLAAGCKMLIMDEPTRGIDVMAKEEIHKLMMRCADNGMTVLAVSSEMEELISICDRVLIMHEGRQKGIEETKDMTPAKILEIALSK